MGRHFCFQKFEVYAPYTFFLSPTLIYIQLLWIQNKIFFLYIPFTYLPITEYSIDPLLYITFLQHFLIFLCPFSAGGQGGQPAICMLGGFIGQLCMRDGRISFGNILSVWVFLVARTGVESVWADGGDLVFGNRVHEVVLNFSVIIYLIRKYNYLLSISITYSFYPCIFHENKILFRPCTRSSSIPSITLTMLRSQWTLWFLLCLPPYFCSHQWPMLQKNSWMLALWRWNQYWWKCNCNLCFLSIRICNSGEEMCS